MWIWSDVWTSIARICKETQSLSIKSLYSLQLLPPNQQTDNLFPSYLIPFSKKNNSHLFPILSISTFNQPIHNLTPTHKPQKQTSTVCHLRHQIPSQTRSKISNTTTIAISCHPKSIPQHLQHQTTTQHHPTQQNNQQHQCITQYRRTHWTQNISRVRKRNTHSRTTTFQSNLQQKHHQNITTTCFNRHLSHSSRRNTFAAWHRMVHSNHRQHGWPSCQLQHRCQWQTIVFSVS